MLSYDDEDLHSVCLCAWKEARGDGQDAMRAVMHVIKNRVGAPGFKDTIHDVVYGKNQFTSMSVPSDPEFNLEPKDGDKQFEFCDGIVESVFNGTDEDLTKGARYYDNPRTATSGWFERAIVQDPINHPFLTKIGKQDFYS